MLASMATQADLDRLLRCKFSGVLTVEYASDVRVTYRSMDELDRAIATVRAELALAVSQVRRYDRIVPTDGVL